MDLLDELETRVLCGDGAIGTLLLYQGVPIERCFEELCVSEPDRIRTIHQQYVSAGARVIQTNTFGANAVRLERFGMEGRVTEINRAAAGLATKVAKNKNVYVAGSVGPLGFSAKDAAARGIDRAHCFSEQIRALQEGGADLIFFETFTDFEEMKIALRAKKELSDLPEICSFACGPDGGLSSGERLDDAFAKARELGAKIVGANCIGGSQARQLLKYGQPELILSVYPSAGTPKYHEGRYLYPTDPGVFGEDAHALAAKGVRVLGGCCGTTPAHIAAAAAALADFKR